MPTRLFHVLPGGEQGWISESCQRPDYLFDSAPVVAATGRASPSGVVCYRHTQFPENYRGGLFTLDWTFGRVMYVPLVKSGAGYASQQPQEFVTARGQMGFAPTDVEVGMDGSLYLCVGGRGTHGTVYRVQATGQTAPAINPLLTVNDTDTPERRMAACLDAPQPASSWSRSRWVPLATKLGAQEFLKVALDEHQSVAARIRAIEILTDLFAGLPGTAAEILAMVKSPELRARAAWSLGVRPPQGMTSAVLVQFLHDADPMVRRRALEAAARSRDDLAGLLPAIAKCTNDEDRLVRLTAARLMPTLKPAQFKEVADLARKLSWRAALTTTLGYIWRTNDSSPTPLQRLRRRYRPQDSRRQTLPRTEARGGAHHPDRSRGPLPATKRRRPLSPATLPRKTCRPTSGRSIRCGSPSPICFRPVQRHLDLELSRLAAMIIPANDQLLAKVLSQITSESHPTDDIHFLLVAARLPVRPGPDQRDKIAATLLGLEAQAGPPRSAERQQLERPHRRTVRGAGRPAIRDCRDESSPIRASVVRGMCCS